MMILAAKIVLSLSVPVLAALTWFFSSFFPEKRFPAFFELISSVYFGYTLWFAVLGYWAPLLFVFGLLILAMRGPSILFVLVFLSHYVYGIRIFLKKIDIVDFSFLFDGVLISYLMRPVNFFMFIFPFFLLNISLVALFLICLPTRTARSRWKT
jgi:hypothetical protein